MNIPSKKKDLLTLYDSWYGKELLKKIVIVSEEESKEENFKEPSTYYSIDALGSLFFFKTNSRAKAIESSDLLFGKGKYPVKRVVKAVCR